MIVEIACLEELDFRMSGSHIVGEGKDTLDQNTGEEEVGKDNDPLVTKLGGMFEAGLDQWESHTGIANFAPTKAKTFPQHPHDLVDI